MDCSDAKESGVRKVMGSYRTYSISGKTAALVPEFAVEDLPSWSGQFYGKISLFQYIEPDLSTLYRKFTFLQLVILQKTDATMEKK